MKYRILEYAGKVPTYQAQYKFLNLFWVNCNPDYFNENRTRSVYLNEVQHYIENQIGLRQKPKVIQTY